MIIDPKGSRQTEYHESYAVLINTYKPNSLGQPCQLQASLSSREFRQAHISMLVCGVCLFITYHGRISILDVVLRQMETQIPDDHCHFWP